jgi:hypothetical protein
VMQYGGGGVGGSPLQDGGALSFPPPWPPSPHRLDLSGSPCPLSRAEVHGARQGPDTTVLRGACQESVAAVPFSPLNLVTPEPPPPLPASLCISALSEKKCA